MSNLLEINNLTVSFENPNGELTAVKGVSLSLNANETLALVGESGCGKTVLCKSMLKILCGSGRIRRGEILLGGEDLVLADERQMQKLRGGEIAMVFQDPMTSLDPAFSVGAQIAEVLQIHKGLSKDDAKHRAIELMQMVQIPEADKRYDQRPGQFSGGMRQRIAIAVALAGEPKLLLADEPTTALDEDAQQAILQLLKKIQRETGVAILFITHDLSLVEDVASRVAIMKDGVIVEEGRVADVFAAPIHPYTRKLLGFLDYKKDRGHHHGTRYRGDGERSDKHPSACGKPREYFDEERFSEACFDGRSGGLADGSEAYFGRRDGGLAAGNVQANPQAESQEGDVSSAGQVLAGKPMLSVQHLCKSFQVGKAYQHTVLDDFNLDIYRGEIVGLIGRSGCGKSTLARCIMGIEPFEAGIIEAGTRNFQMIFQDSQSAFNDRMTVGEIIAEPLRIAAGKRRWLARMAGRFAKKDVVAVQSTDTADRTMRTGGKRRDAAVQAMRSAGFCQDAVQTMQIAKRCQAEAVAQVMCAVELPVEIASRKPYELSGGQRQRTAIARALITKPDFIIADEPLTGLDVSAQAQIVHLFKKLAVENDLTILFIAHDLPMVNHISDRVIRMD